MCIALSLGSKSSPTKVYRIIFGLLNRVKVRPVAHVQPYIIEKASFIHTLTTLASQGGWYQQQEGDTRSRGRYHMYMYNPRRTIEKWDKAFIFYCSLRAKQVISLDLVSPSCCWYHPTWFAYVVSVLIGLLYKMHIIIFQVVLRHSHTFLPDPC